MAAIAGAQYAVEPAGVICETAGQECGRSELTGDGEGKGLIGGLMLGFAVAACTPTVQVQAPREPITINLNVKLDAEVRVKIEEQADKDIKENPDIF